MQVQIQSLNLKKFPKRFRSFLTNFDQLPTRASVVPPPGRFLRFLQLSFTVQGQHENADAVPPEGGGGGGGG